MSEKEKVRQKQMIRNKKSFIFLLILCLGIGFAFLSTQLNINGTTNVLGSKWSVYFENIDVKEDSVQAELPTIDTNKTTVDFEVTLANPGDYYEFTVDAVNDGTIDAMIESISMTELTSNVLKYLDYKVTYEDGSTIAKNDVLEAKSSTTYKVLVEFKKDVVASDLSEENTSLNLSFTVNYVQSTIKLKRFVKLIKDSALSDSSIDFIQTSSDVNGKGLYVRTGTESNDNPIYYYRGAVTNNNAKFAGFCWKIVRTTDTGGTKLIYNGKPNGNGECTNTTGAGTQVSTVGYNTYHSSLAYNGYMYGTPYDFNTTSYNASNVYGNAFTYENGVYTLSNTQIGLDNTHHYTCFNDTGTCSEVAYVYYLASSDPFYILLSDGKNVEDAIREMQTNTTSSTIKTAVDNWFQNTFMKYFTDQDKDYKKYLEDTIWCNDRSMNTLGTDTQYINNGWNPNGGSTSNGIHFSTYGRINNYSPSLVCSNKNNSFTVEESQTGNGALTYPVGLLTTDEVMLAGGKGASSSDYYLNTNKSWWTMSPSTFEFFYTYSYYVNSNGSISNYGTDNFLGLRPSISVASSVKVVTGGDGTATSPYEFVVE